MCVCVCTKPVRWEEEGGEIGFSNGGSANWKDPEKHPASPPAAGAQRGTRGGREPGGESGNHSRRGLAVPSCTDAVWALCLVASASGMQNTAGADVVRHGASPGPPGYGPHAS